MFERATLHHNSQPLRFLGLAEGGALWVLWPGPLFSMKPIRMRAEYRAAPSPHLIAGRASLRGRSVRGGGAKIRQAKSMMGNDCSVRTDPPLLILPL